MRHLNWGKLNASIEEEIHGGVFFSSEKKKVHKE